jgi:hypothetical protein
MIARSLIWFAIGAAVGCLQLLVSIVRKPTSDTGTPLSGVVAAAIGGAVVYGIPLWLFAWVIG